MVEGCPGLCGKTLKTKTKSFVTKAQGHQNWAKLLEHRPSEVCCLARKNIVSVLGHLHGELAKIQELKGEIRLSWGFWEKLWGGWGTPPSPRWSVGETEDSDTLGSRPLVLRS